MLDGSHKTKGEGLLETIRCLKFGGKTWKKNALPGGEKKGGGEKHRNRFAPTKGEATRKKPPLNFVKENLFQKKGGYDLRCQLGPWKN